jgi:hypothetical protein
MISGTRVAASIRRKNGRSGIGFLEILKVRWLMGGYSVADCSAGAE